MPVSASITPLVAMFSLFVIGLPIFAAVNARRGRPRTDRIERAGGSFLLSTWLMEYGYWFMGVPARAFIRAGVSPDFVTYLGLLMITLGSVAIGCGYFGLGGWTLCFGSMLDAMDGMVARAQGKSSDAGEFLDAVVDRYAEIGCYIGLVYYYNELWWGLGSILCALLGSLMVSYVRAKAEALGVNPPSGIMRRQERALYLGAGCAMSPVVAHFTEPGNPHPNFYLTLTATTLIAIFANYSALRSIKFSLNALRQQRAQKSKLAA
jgi:phosphatidylglycerophosphate synthase